MVLAQKTFDVAHMNIQIIGNLSTLDYALGRDLLDTRFKCC